MKVLTIGEGSEFKINDLFDNTNFDFYKLIIKESLHGDISSIELHLMTDAELPDINTVYSGYLTSNGGIKNNFKCYLYEITGSPLEYTLKFLCCDPVFTRGISTDSYTKIDDAIKFTSKGFNRLDSVKTDLLDLNDDYRLHQGNQTNYQFCTKLCWMYKFNTVFGYLLDGIRFIDLKSEDLNHPVGDPLIDRVHMKLDQPAKWTNSKYFDQKIKFIDYSKGKDPNHQLVSYYNKVIPVNSVFKDYIGNYLYNTRLRSMKNTNSFELPQIQDYQVGDCVEVRSSQFNYGKCIITSRIIVLDRSKPSVKYVIQSI